MQVTRIHDGLWRWAVARDGVDVASAYLEHGDAMLVVDPVLPPPGDHLDAFTRAIERDLARLPGPPWVLLTRNDDPRDSAALADMTGAAVWRPASAPRTDAPAGLRAIPTGRPGEVALWSAEHRALMPGTALAVQAGRAVAAPGVDAAPLLAPGPEVIIPSVGPMLPAAG